MKETGFKTEEHIKIIQCMQIQESESIIFACDYAIDYFSPKC